MSKLTTLNINGALKETQTELETPLLFVLREDFNLTGTKAGCLEGQCGACTVMINGKAERSCSIAIETLRNSQIVTIEGLDPELEPLQQAFIDEQAAQCGYCIPGIIMSAAALLKDKPSSNLTDIQEALKENLCRCGSHSRILKAIVQASRRTAL